MFKRIGLSVALLAGLLIFAAPRKANAEVHFGVILGAPAPVYTAPPPPAYGYDPYGYDPYAGGYGYDYAPPAYDYPAPAYVSPYSGYGYGGGYYGGWGWGGHERHEWREHERHEMHEMREHGGWGRGWRR